MLEIPLNFGPDAGYKQNRFLKTLPKKSFELVLSRRSSIVGFNLSFVLLSSKNSSCYRETKPQKVRV